MPGARSPLALLGCGPVGRALAGELLRSGGGFRGPLIVWSRSAGSVRALQRALGGARRRLCIASGPAQALAAAQVVLLAVADLAQAALAEEWAAEGGTKGTPPPARGRARPAVVLTTSGSLPLAALAPLARVGHALGRLHPLCPLPEGRTWVGACAYGIEGDPAALGAARALFTRRWLRGRPLGLSSEPGSLAAYHAGASLLSGGLVALFAEADRALARALPAPKARRAALLGLLDETRTNLAERAPAAALTGAVARGSEAVVRAHLAALRDFPEAQAAYRALGATMLALARARGTLDARDARRLARLLGGAGARAR